MTVGERLQKYRKQHNLSQEDLAKQLFVTRQTISLWETDQTLPTIDNLVRLKDILEVSIDDILTGPEDKPEEENHPLESYEFKYSKPIFKSVFKTVNIKSFLTHLVLALLLILNTVRTYFVVTDDISKGLYWGFTIIAVIFFMRYIISIARVWKISKNNALKNEYQYDVFEDSIKLTVAKDGQAITTKIITPENISRCWSTNSLYIFIYQNSIYALKKQCLDSNSHLHLFFHKGRKSKKKNVVLSILLIFLFAVSICLPFVQNDGYVTLTQLVDNKNSSVTVSASEYINEIEKTIDIEFPQSVTVVNSETFVGETTFRDEIYYNVIELKISDYNAYKFEKSIENDERWRDFLSQNFDDILPRGYNDAKSDYKLFYNATNDEYNRMPTVDGDYEFWYLSYYDKGNYFVIVNYTITYHTEHKDPKYSIENQNNWWSDEILSTARLEGCTVAGVLYGNIISTEEKSEVHLLKDDRYNSMYHDLYLAVETDESVYFYDFADSDVNYSGAYFEDLYLADLDGDGLDEIIVNRCIAMSGGAGGYISQVFKYYGYADFRMIFNSENTFEYYTGFTSELKDGFKLEINNVFTGYKTVIDYNNATKYRGVYWDESGKVIRTQNYDYLMYDSFREFYPEDVDGDGIDELVCLQYTSLYSHSDYIGNAKTVLKYNEKYKTFEVIDAEFIPYEE